MQGVTTLFDPALNERVESIWRELEHDVGVRGVLLTPIPHFSFFVAARFEGKTLAADLESMASTLAPFTVHTSGFGVFTGGSPIVYLPVVRTAVLTSLHRTLWDRLAPHTQQMNAYYAPDTWLPHITLAFGDVTPANLPRIVERLATRNLVCQIRVDNLALVEQQEGQVGRVNCRVAFGGH